ncbi:methyltransferase domain-containing protein [Myxococcota bacterium]|nr:methyltransferase domain-containing protein [Myxococcota bacterium]MBU1533911.1 methyltransferase domain-containing protein [Myxococcota bacterium]
MEPFCTSDLIHSGDLYDCINNFHDDEPFYLEKCSGKTVLELCCGTGRLTIPLAKQGVDIRGLDLSKSMLERAREKATREGVPDCFLWGDMRDFSLGKTFDVVFIPFNSLQCIYSTTDLERVFERVHRHLAAKGRFIFDVFNPSIHLMVERESGWHPVTRFEHGGREVEIDEQCAYDDLHQVNRVKWRYTMGTEVTMEPLDMRCFYPQEMMALLRHNGFAVEQLLGDFQQNPFEQGCAKMIFVCKSSL